MVFCRLQKIPVFSAGDDSSLGYVGCDAERKSKKKSGFSDFLFIFGLSRGVLGVGRSLEMILSHMAPSSLNMSPYRAIWTALVLELIFSTP